MFHLYDFQFKDEIDYSFWYGLIYPHRRWLSFVSVQNAPIYFVEFNSNINVIWKSESFNLKYFIITAGYQIGLTIQDQIPYSIQRHPHLTRLEYHIAKPAVLVFECISFFLSSSLNFVKNLRPFCSPFKKKSVYCVYLFKFIILSSNLVLYILSKWFAKGKI